MTTDWIKAIFGSEVLVSAGPIGVMTPEAIIAKYREMMPNETRWATDEMLMKRAWGLANWFNSLGEGIYKTSDGQPTDAWWDSVVTLANPGNNLRIPSRPLGSIEEELDPEEASAITPVGRHYWELVRQHPEDPLYWKLADPARFDYFIMYYEDRRPEEEPFDPTRYQQDLARRIAKDFPPRQDVAASSIWGEIGFGEVLRKADKMGRRSEFVQYAKQFWTQGQGFSRNPSEIFEEWAGQHGVGFDAASIEDEIRRGVIDAYEKVGKEILSWGRAGLREDLARGGYDPATKMVTLYGIGPLPPYEWGLMYAGVELKTLPMV